MTATPTLATRSGSAMGSRFHLVVTGGHRNGTADEVVDHLVARLAELEQRWSRFRPTSEVSRINASPDQWHIVSHDTATLVDTARRAWRLTAGAYDPTVLAALTANGYDVDLDAVHRRDPRTTSPASGRSPSPGCAGVEVDLATGLVRLGPSTGIDPGGIGKGLAADLLVADALDAGADGALANIGGDVVCSGHPPSGRSWIVDVAEPTVRPDRIARLHLEEGAVVTSTTAKRRWATTDGTSHHIVDPRTGAPTLGPRLVTVVAATGWWAEAVAKQVMVTGVAGPIDLGRAAAIVIDESGAEHRLGDVEAFGRPLVSATSERDRVVG